MASEKFRGAQSALDRFIYDVLASQDEVSLYRCSKKIVVSTPSTTDNEDRADETAPDSLAETRGRGQDAGRLQSNATYQEMQRAIEKLGRKADAK